MEYHIQKFAVLSFVLTLLFGALSGGLSASPALVSHHPPREPQQIREILVFRLHYYTEAPAPSMILAPSSSAERPPVRLPALLAQCLDYARRLDAKGYTGAYC